MTVLNFPVDPRDGLNEKARAQLAADMAEIDRVNRAAAKVIRRTSRRIREAQQRLSSIQAPIAGRKGAGRSP